ncbi:uncharacterized protein LOC129694857 [Leucoraja erinacea]|uniref:uncharacterized protein LOC129694857 n=1 Tax=Leucoraja erinaceus TaxID=7782 RepID=UPI002453C6D0|nr:uncharacterized protein LOC129694857 [Leucoraja erinacea]
MLPKFKQYVDFETRGENILDLVYTNTPEAYKAAPRPHLGHSDHISVFLTPAYRPLLKQVRAERKHTRVWPEGAASALQDCFLHTDWYVFRTAASYDDLFNIEEYAETVTSYIAKCTEDVTIMKTFTARGNEKPWMTAEVRSLLRARDAAYRAGNTAALRSTRTALEKGIRAAKRAFAGKIQGHLCDTGDTRRMWKGIQTLTGYKARQQVTDTNTSLPDELNNFFARFDAANTTPKGRASPCLQTDQPVLTIDSMDTRRILSKVNPWKAVGPDNIPGRVLKECAEELADVLTNIFNISLSQAIVPTSLKTSMIIPIAKKPVVACLNDYRPVALTPIIMKCFERLVKPHITASLPSSLPIAPTVLQRMPSLPRCTQYSRIWKTKTHTPESCTLTSAQRLTPSSHRDLWRN